MVDNFSVFLKQMKSESWDDIDSNFNAYMKQEGYDKSIKDFTTWTKLYFKWLQDNYNPPTKKK